MYQIQKSKTILLLCFALAMLFSMTACSAASVASPIRVMCYGDSNTWGWMPVKSGSTTRYPADVRWTGQLQKELGSHYQIIEEGLNGRTAGVDDYENSLDPQISSSLNLNGEPSLLPILKSQAPLDIVVVMRGTNDVKPHLHQDLGKVTASLDRLVLDITRSTVENQDWTKYKAPKVLVVAPVPVHPGQSQDMNTTFAGGYDLSAQLGAAYQKVAQKYGADYLDASTVIPQADGLDGIHLSPAGHQKLSQAIAAKIKAMR